MLEVIKTIVTFVPLVFGVISSTVAVINGFKSVKNTKKLTATEQENDLRDFMVEECSRVEAFSMFLKGSMNKDQLSEWKKTEVLKNIGLYASANGYSWYNKGVWDMKLENYITSANHATGKLNKTATLNAG